MTAVLADPIAALDLRFIQVRLTHQEGPHQWEPGRAVVAIAGYRAYLGRVKQNPGKRLPPGSKDVDAVWHEHILHTKKYKMDCAALFGRFIHHTPRPLGSKRGQRNAADCDCDGCDCE